MKKIAFIDASYCNTSNKKFSGVGYYRLQLPAKFLKEDYDITVYQRDLENLGKNNEEMFGNLFKDHDMVVTKAVDNPHACAALGFFSQYYKKPLIIDLDDNYFTVRPDQPGYKFYYPGSQKVAILSSYLASASGFIFSTRPLLNWHRKYLKNLYGLKPPMFLCPNFNDLTEFKKPAKKDKDIVIGWQGSTTHLSDLRLVMPAIIRILKKHPKIKFDILGGLDITQAKLLFEKMDIGDEFERIRIMPGTPSWEAYPELLSKQRWDIGIAPLIDDEFNRNKSHIKWMEYATQKIPCVASKVYPYFMDINKTKTIEHGKTGYLASTEQEWFDILQALIENDKLRLEIGENAYNFVKENWQADKQIGAWKKAFDSFLK